MWILWKMRFSKCEFWQKWDFENVNFVKNEILETWILSKMGFSKCESRQKLDFRKANFVKIVIFQSVIFFLIQFGFLSQCEGEPKEHNWHFLFPDCDRRRHYDATRWCRRCHSHGSRKIWRGPSSDRQMVRSLYKRTSKYLQAKSVSHSSRYLKNANDPQNMHQLVIKTFQGD